MGLVIPPPPDQRTRTLFWVLVGAIGLLAAFQAHALATGPRELDDPPPAEDEQAEAPEQPAAPNDDEEEDEDEPTPMNEHPVEIESLPAAAAHKVAKKDAAPAGIDLWRKARLDGQGYAAAMKDGRAARLTIDPRLQRTIDALFKSYKPMAGSVVAMDPKTGRLLAMAEYSRDGKTLDLATRPLYPAASVFKIITGAALLEKGVSPDAETCYHGGMRRMVARLLQDRPRVDRRCLSLSMALAKSTNVVFGKLAVRHLDAGELRREAEKFLFNRPIWTQAGVEQSPAVIPEAVDKLEFAKSAAGFGRVRLSPMHAAVIASAVANGGVAVEPTLLGGIEGEELPAQPSQRLLAPETASRLRDMMKLTVSDGTARSSFRERRRWVLGDIEVSGKTGSLADRRPYKDYSWFVGFAPADNPTIAVAAVVVNGRYWRIKAPYVAREALRAYLVGGPRGDPPQPKARHKRHKRRWKNPRR